MAHSLKLLAEKYSQVIENLNGEAVKKTVKKEITKEARIVNGKEVDRQSLEVDGVDANDYPDFSDAFVRKGFFKDGTKMSEEDLNEFNDTHSDVAQELALDRMTGMGDSYEGKHAETDMSNPKERTEVHIANEILKATDMKQVKSLAEELLKMHGQKASDDGPLYPPYGGHNKE